ncbi:hypothetical protein AC578_3256 [Pseudocercospora eumusae]|uniref:Uncharacterized protein n=1 Tax=Pseudocercospora eumusae TaxID=321146 RepID=A0A139GZF2_9PEZI|nr:hypothetical protein AC578_3256 [Pseudocercospora eumusae]
MALSPPRKRTGFFDLSAELRNRIYGLALTNGDDETPLRIRYHCKNGEQRPCLDNQGLSPNILATCKRIHQEATPILYGNLIRYDLYNLSRFFGGIKQSIRYLRHLDLAIQPPTGYNQAASESLPAAKSLINLTMSTIYQVPPDSAVFRYILPLVRVIRANRLREGMPSELRGCIKLRICYHCSFSDRGWQAKINDFAKSYKEQLVSMLEKELGIAEESDKTLAKTRAL